MKLSSRLRALVVALVALALSAAPVHAQPAAAAENRLKVVLVLDASGSMAANDPKKIVAVAGKIFTELLDERDHVTVLSFGTGVTKLGEARGDQHDALRSAVGQLGRADACTDYGQALEGAAREFTGKPPATERRVVLFLTDGKYEPARSGAGCGPFETGSGPDVDAADARVRAAGKQLAAAGARVFTVVLGRNALAAQRSAALLGDVARETSGRFVPAPSAQDVPQVFASILGVLVGAPVTQDSLGPGRSRITLNAPRGSDRLHVVLVPETASDVESATLRRGAAAIPFEPVRAESTASGYRIARIVGEASGEYVLEASVRNRVSVLFIPDAGLSLRIEGVPAVLPEGDRLTGRVALRSRAGDAVKLAPDFISKIVFTVSMDGKPIFDQRPDAEGIAKFGTQTGMPKGTFRLKAAVRHELGFVDVPAVEQAFSVEPRFAVKIRGEGASFDVMAEEGPIPLRAPAAFVVESPDPVPVDVTFDVKLPDSAAKDLVVEPRTITFGPKHPRRVALTLAFVDDEALRWETRRWEGSIELVPTAAASAMLVGEKGARAPLDGRLRSWDLAHWLSKNWKKLAVGLGALLLVIWIVGRLVARRFSPKARVRWLEVGQAFETDSLIKRHARHGAFQAARLRFPLGKKAKSLVVFRATAAGFEVEQAEGKAVQILDDTLPEAERSPRKPFRGRWDQRYRVDGRYDVWLTRT